MIYLCAVAHRTKRNTINLLILFKGIARKLYTHVAQYARVIVRIIAAMLRARATFYLGFPCIMRSLTTDDKSTPITRLTLSLSCF